MRQTLYVLGTLMCLSACGQSSSLSETECQNLIEGVVEIPFKPDLIPVLGTYTEIMQRRDEKPIADCLLSQITNSKIVIDPRKSFPGPTPDLSIGDVSVFMLTEMYDIQFSSFLTEAGWKHRGIFEYYKFIEQDGAHEKIQAVFKPIIEKKFID